jgi:6-phosphofructokinase
MQLKRIGVLTSGGDCPGLNAVLRGVTKAAEKLNWQVIGFKDGLEGLLPPSQYIILDRERTAGIMQQGGTILGTTNKGHFVAKFGHGEKARVLEEVVEKAHTTLRDLRVEGLMATRFGVKAVQLIDEGKFGTMVSYQNYEIHDVPIAQAVHRLRLVDPNNQLVQTARAVDIYFGD